MTIEELERYKLPVTEQILAELIHAGGKSFVF
jgi:hypothetical protein